MHFLTVHAGDVEFFNKCEVLLYSKGIVIGGRWQYLFKVKDEYINNIKNNKIEYNNKTYECKELSFFTGDSAYFSNSLPKRLIDIEHLDFAHFSMYEGYWLKFLDIYNKDENFKIHVDRIRNYKINKRFYSMYSKIENTHRNSVLNHISSCEFIEMCKCRSYEEYLMKFSVFSPYYFSNKDQVYSIDDEQFNDNPIEWNMFFKKQWSLIHPDEEITVFDIHY